MRNFLISFSIILVVTIFGNSQIVISEIMYNSPDTDDKFEYLELYNNSQDTIQLKNYRFIDGIDHIFESFAFAPNSFFVLVKDSLSIKDLNISAHVWNSGGLKNKGETIILVDSFGIIVDSVDYSDRGDWPMTPDGDGPSLELCSYEKDNSLAKNWKPSTNGTGIFIDGSEIIGTPGETNSISCKNDTFDYLITLSGIEYNPNNLIINIGEIVKWQNIDGNHNVNGNLTTFPENPEGFGNGQASEDKWEYYFKFTKPGIYKYQCDTHSDSGMSGTITVNDKKQTTLLITEFLYNDNGSPDSLEFIEIYNYGIDTTFLSGIKLTSGTIDFTFPNYFLPPNQNLVISKFKQTLDINFNINSLSWGIGGLNNKNDTIKLIDTKNNLIDIVEYSENGNWSPLADGLGYSLSLCDIQSDNNIGLNWQPSPVYSGLEYKGVKIFANPGENNYCNFNIPFLKETDSLGTITHKSINPYLTGTVYGTNFNGDGLQFVLTDNNNNGIWVYNHKNDFNYKFHEGDKVALWGKMGQFNGLTQVYLDSIILIETDSLIGKPIIITKLEELTEGQLVKIKDLHLLDHTKWTNKGSGFNIKVANNNDTFNIRIDKDTDIFNKPHPVGTFSITGIGSQYDKTSPYLNGYQLLPRYTEDFDPFATEKYPFKQIPEVTKVDDEGNGLSLNTNCELRGIVYGINFNPSGTQFTVIDNNSFGISVFHKNKNLKYVVNEGDYISVKGIINQFNGLLQINPDTIILISKNNDLLKPKTVINLDESTESNLIKIENVRIKNVSNWKGDGSSFNVTITNGNTENTMRIDNNVDFSTISAPEYSFNVFGIGTQYDKEAPYLDSYQIMPRYMVDIDKISNNNEEYLDNISLYPNPVTNKLIIDSKNHFIKSVSIYSILGEKIMTSNSIKVINLRGLQAGTYIVKIETEKGINTRTLIKL